MCPSANASSGCSSRRSPSAAATSPSATPSPPRAGPPAGRRTLAIRSHRRPPAGRRANVRHGVGGAIWPRLTNLYLHVLDRVWVKHGAPLGSLVRYADDFVVMCPSARACEEAQGRIEHVLGRLGLKLHPQKTRRVELSAGKEG